MFQQLLEILKFITVKIFEKYCIDSQKLEVLDKLNRGSSQKAIAAEYNVGRYCIYKLKDKVFLF